MNTEEAATPTQCQELAKLLHENTAILAALGDETNQYILIQMLRKAGTLGLRIGEIAALSNLSRAAASRHIQELTKAGLLRMRKEGTKHYYLFNQDSPALYHLYELLDFSIRLLDGFPKSMDPDSNSEDQNCKNQSSENQSNESQNKTNKENAGPQSPLPSCQN